MDIWQLKVFVKVIELEGFSKAGKAVHLTQPTVSSHVKDLEDYFECKLVDRMGRKALPTGAGRILYSHAKKIIKLSGEMEESISRFMGVVSGNLAIGGSTIPGGYILPRLIGDFKKRYPGIGISIEVGDTRQVVDDITNSRIDFGVVGARVNQPGIVQERLFADEMRLVVPAGHKWANKKTVSLPSLLKEPFIMREKGSGTLASLQSNLAEKGLGTGDFTTAAILGSTTAVIQGIKSGIGVSIVSAIAVADDVRAEALAALPVRGLDLRRHFYLTYHKNRSFSPLCEAFTEFLKTVDKDFRG